MEAEEISLGRDSLKERLLPPSGARPATVKAAKPTIDILKEEALSCTRCDLSETRTNVVFGAGNTKAALMFVGEAPGMQEDLQGLPFVGRAGALLTKIIESIGLKRSDVYIANVLKCRPPENRNPLPTEILTCEEYLIKQIEFIKPKVICALGKFAAQTLLRTQEPITKLRGRFYDYHHAKLMPTFHPAYLLRNPQDKKLVWEDMKKIRKELGANNE
ncbi:MAG: uracil-DNA glycosylase [Candidatus Omnitrophica bacterium]|nr:uracil-DNA glycosylase [Candidatus Omnitrophota bacterium]